MIRSPLFDEIDRYICKNNIYFCMPGHKMGRGFHRDEYGERILKNIITGDLTEIDGLDNLYAAEEVLKDEMELLSQTYGSAESLFLVNGSTSGNHIMMFSALEEFQKIIIERNCHKSITDGVIMRKLKPVYINGYDYSEYDAPLVFNEEHIISVMEDNPDAAAIILTYPNYYGGCLDLERVISKAKTLNMKVLIDSAHGAHFGINERLPKSAVKLGADMVVTSAHKTLPSLTQTAYLHINNRELINKGKKYWKRFSSTSPSYLFMMSMAYSRYYLQKYGEKDYDVLIDLALEYREKILSLNKVDILKGKRDFIDVDLTRYTIVTPKGYSGDKLADYLLSKGIQCEMSNHRCVVMILSYFNTRDEFQKLYEELKELSLEDIRESDKISLKDYEEYPETVMYPYEADDMPVRKVAYMESEGEVCGSAVIPYPPGVPIINPGERITREIIDHITLCMDAENKILGIENGKIEVIKM